MLGTWHFHLTLRNSLSISMKKKYAEIFDGDSLNRITVDLYGGNCHLNNIKSSNPFICLTFNFSQQHLIVFSVWFLYFFYEIYF